MSSLNSSPGAISATQLFASDIRYSAWASQRLLDACAGLSAEELERDLGISHSSIVATLRHLYDAERVWLDCLSTTAPGGSWRLPTGPAPKLSLIELQQTWPKLWKGYDTWLEGLSEAEIKLKEDFLVQIPDGSSPQFARWKILRHVLDHAQFHRGQVIGMIRSLGHTPPAINRGDYWLAGGSDGRRHI
ncbi:MAG: DinB family protein [Candidatus Sulfotelmatobacter sp.]